MARKGAGLLAGVAMAVGMSAIAAPASATVTVDYYSSYTDTGSDVVVSGSPFASATAPDIFLGDGQTPAINTAALWPGAGVSFAAIIKGVSTQTGLFNLALTSDDGSYLFINHVLSLSNGGSHGGNTVSGPFNLHVGDLLEVRYYNSYCCGAVVKLDGQPALDPPGGGPRVPEPASWAMMISGFGIAGMALRRRQGRLPVKGTAA